MAKSNRKNPRPFSKDELFGISLNREVKNIPIGEDVAEFHIQEMTASQVQRHSAKLLTKKGTADVEQMSKSDIDMVYRHVINPDGSKMFENGDLPRVGSLGNHIIAPLAKSIAELSGISVKVDDLKGWLGDNHPEILKAFQDEMNPITEKKEN